MTELTGVPETMLWTLHNRGSEAVRPDGFIRDQEAARIYASIDYDYARNFGRPDGSHATRSVMFDEVVGDWMKRHPGGTVVELGCGLETQFQRIDDGQVRWLCVDVPEAIAVRERFLAPSERCRFVPKSALDLSWMDAVETSGPVFVTAQGLLMYFEEAEVKRLLTAILDRFPDVELMFDVIPPWFSRKTMSGLQKTRHYRAPEMPWGVGHSELEPLLRSWSPRIGCLRMMPYRRFRIFPWSLPPLIASIPGLREAMPWIVHVAALDTERG
ncbi:O-methyltransferase domain-containing protein [Thiorhodococcus drewsii AZ1]|uniref:O-methyltransferase domain-containing protein n=1 Tax=Thiorhodococcus drewsii AZ1 TaxID=765913 RepID=G2E489_9GAMM|nr:class I SAM-dependent methyltransferase [Thiorhodococcus drewsii]EGV29816.1 O-methyltransferase domain-containing protein [Thiorhodococcus drewsii AZ1]